MVHASIHQVVLQMSCQVNIGGKKRRNTKSKISNSWEKLLRHFWSKLRVCAALGRFSQNEEATMNGVSHFLSLLLVLMGV